MNKKLSTKAFSLLELSLVILIIGVLIAAFLGATDLTTDAKLRRAKTLTQNSPVSSISDLALWLDTTSDQSFLASEVADGAAISRWNDLNPEASTANYLTNSSGTASDHPVYTDNCIGGLPCLYFNGTGSRIYSSRPLGVRTKYISAFFVLTGPDNATGSFNFFTSDKNASWDINTGLFILTGSIGQSFFYDLPSNYGVQYTVCNGAAKLASKQKYIYSVVDDYTTSIFHYVNGAVANNSGGNGSVTKSLGTVEIGMASYKGGVGEVIIFKKVLTTAERKSVEQYLSKKWDIRISS